MRHHRRVGKKAKKCYNIGAVLQNNIEDKLSYMELE